MFCKNCGTQLPEGTVFCPRCGTQQVQAQTPAPAAKKGSNKTLAIILICVCSALVLALCITAVFLIKARKEIDYLEESNAYNLTQDYDLTDAGEAYTEGLSEAETEATTETTTKAPETTTEKVTTTADIPIIKRLIANDWAFAYNLNTGFVETVSFDELGGFVYEAVDDEGYEARESGEYKILDDNRIQFTTKTDGFTTTLTLIGGSSLVRADFNGGFGNYIFDADKFNAYNSKPASSSVAKNLGGKWKGTSDSAIKGIVFSGTWDNMHATVTLKDGKVFKDQFFQPMTDTAGKLYLDGYNRSFYVDLRKDQLIVSSVDEINNSKLNAKQSVLTRA